MDRLTARDPAFARKLRAKVRGEVREHEALARYSTYRIGGPATVVLPAGPEDVADGASDGARGGRPLVRRRARLEHPAAGRRARRARDSSGEGARQPPPGRRALDHRGGTAGAARRAEDRRGGVRRAPHLRRRAGHRRRGGVHERGLPWRRLVRGRRAGDGGGRDGETTRCSTGARCRSPTGGAAWTAASCSTRPSASAPRRRRGSTSRSPRCSNGGSGARHSTSRAAAACSRIRPGPSWKREGGPRTAGQLVEAAGLKGVRIGGAQVSPMHANYFVNAGNATAADVRALIERAQREVETRFEVRLEPEVKLIGRWVSTSIPSRDQASHARLLRPRIQLHRRRCRHRRRHQDLALLPRHAGRRDRRAVQPGPERRGHGRHPPRATT